MTLGHVVGLGIISGAFAQSNQSINLRDDVSKSRIALEAGAAASAFICANVLRVGIQASLLTVATSGAVIALTAFVTIQVARVIFDALRLNYNSLREISFLTIVALNAFLTPAALATQFGFTDSLGEFLNVGFSAAVAGIGLLYTTIVVKRICRLMFQEGRANLAYERL